ncbi:hypothetical protein KR018_008397, partial [Drosophila ironensis]
TKEDKLEVSNNEQQNHPQKYPFREYMQKIKSLFPLPEKPPSLCHDEFIRQLLAPYVLDKKIDHVVSSSDSSSDMSFRDVNSVFHAKMYRTDYKARATMYMARATNFRVSLSGHRTKSSLSISQRASVHITTLAFKTRFRKLISEFRTVCVIFQLRQLQKVLNVMREFPPPGTDPNDTIFAWSYKKNVKRFELNPTIVYVDIFESNKSQATLNDLKFYVDLTEIMRLVDILLSNVIRNKDLCAPRGFMEFLTDTTMDIDKIIALPYETVLKEHDALVAEIEKKAAQADKYLNPKLMAKQHVLKKERFLSDYIMPVETRYKINWAHDKKEQVEFNDDLHCMVRTQPSNYERFQNNVFAFFAFQYYYDEIKELADLTEKDLQVWQSVQLQYTYLIDSYKKRTDSIQQAYDEDMETAENMVQSTLNRVNKCKDDLRGAIEKVEMYRKKTQEVRDKIAQAAEEERARLSAVSDRLNQFV